MGKLKKAAMCTDLHLGRKNNSEDHNEDCYNFIKWFCDVVKNDSTIDHVYFLGDWHEQRSAINGLTLKYSNECAKMLNSLGLPVYFHIGNHDCHMRSDRSIFTTEIFEHLSNFVLIDQIKKCDEIYGSVLMIPYLFHEEYPELLKYSDIPVAIGHLELNGFVLTGEHTVMKHGPNHKDFFKKQKRVFSGHFHKRQQKDNIMYIGNTFPMDYSDANDNERGMTCYDFVTDTITHKTWPDAPTYIKCKLSDIMDEDSNVLKKGARVKCIVDIDITYSESIELKKILIADYNLKELFLEEESEEMRESLEETVIDENSLSTESTAELVASMLTQINNSNIDNDLLVKIYKGKI
jgi:DNA repair exonuclease SbcCD nuclease subunit